MTARHTRGGLNSHSPRDATWQSRRARDLRGGAAQNLRTIAAGEPTVFEESRACYCTGLRHDYCEYGCPEERVESTDE